MLCQNAKHPFLYTHIEKYAGDHPNISEIQAFCENFLKENPELRWSALPGAKREWKNVQVWVLDVPITFQRDIPPLNPIIGTETEGFGIELGRNDVIYSISQFKLEDIETDILFYSHLFYNKG